MKKILTCCLLALPLLVAGCAHPAPAYYALPPTPPPLSPVAHQGFDDGVNAARRDIQTGRPPRFNRHPRFRNPPVPPPDVPEYRRGFRLGYEQALHPPPPPPPPPQ